MVVAQLWVNYIKKRKLKLKNDNINNSNSNNNTNSTLVKGDARLEGVTPA